MVLSDLENHEVQQMQVAGAADLSAFRTAIATGSPTPTCKSASPTGETRRSPNAVRTALAAHNGAHPGRRPGATATSGWRPKIFRAVSRNAKRGMEVPTVDSGMTQR